uniref:TonB-dependent receptor n=1 Tax=Parastrongyloides trichosuri TaxID=131310 RepID=A0A0N4ZEB7_PARTI
MRRQLKANAERDAFLYGTPLPRVVGEFFNPFSNLYSLYGGGNPFVSSIGGAGGGSSGGAGGGGKGGHQIIWGMKILDALRLGARIDGNGNFYTFELSKTGQLERKNIIIDYDDYEPAFSSNPGRYLTSDWREQGNGGLSLAEAKAHWKGGTADALHYPLSSINLKHIHDQDFDYVGQKKYFNLFFRGVGDDRFVYGNIRLEYLGNGKVKAPEGYYDVYDYRKNLNASDLIRDVNTFFGRLYNGSGTPYRIYLSGEANLGIIIHMPNPGDVYGGPKF